MRYKDVWKTIKSFGSEEAIRMRNCRGCIYLGTVGCSGCCDYWAIADRLRPSKFGEKCPVKVMIPGYVIPQDHIEFCERIDERERKRKVQAERQARKRLEWIKQIEEEIKKQAEEDKDTPPPKNRIEHGRPPTWDTKYAFMLFCEGYYIFEIAEIVGTTVQKVTQCAKYNEWGKKMPPDVYRYRHDIEQAKLDYAEYQRRMKEAESK